MLDFDNFVCHCVCIYIFLNCSFVGFLFPPLNEDFLCDIGDLGEQLITTGARLLYFFLKIMYGKLWIISHTLEANWCLFVIKLSFFPFHLMYRLLAHQRISRRGRSIRRRRRGVRYRRRYRIPRNLTVAAADTVAVTRVPTEFRALLHQRLPQLQLVTEQPNEEREYPTEPQWVDWSLNISPHSYT